MEKEFVPYEQALALKELGFDEPCFGYYNIDPQLKTPAFNMVKPFKHEWCLSAPIYQQAFRWFRNNYSIFSSIDVNYFYKIYVNDEFFEESINYNSHEDSELECLKKLIEIVKLK
jgi:hypothetical protein